MNYRIENKPEIRAIGKKIKLEKTREENFRIVPGFWQQCAMDGTIEKLASMMDAGIPGLMGISLCNENEDWAYYIAVASGGVAGASDGVAEAFEELIIPESAWAVFPGEGPVMGMQELEVRIATQWQPPEGYEYANAPEIELYLNPDPENAKYEIWLPIAAKAKTY